MTTKVTIFNHGPNKINAWQKPLIPANPAIQLTPQTIEAGTGIDLIAYQYQDIWIEEIKNQPTFKRKQKRRKADPDYFDNQ